MGQFDQLVKSVDEAKSNRDAMVLAHDRWIINYEIQTGKKDGSRRFESELANLLEIAGDKPDMMRASKWEWFKAMMKISRTGLSLASEGHLYVECYQEMDKDRKPTGVYKIKVTKGNHGKREMLRQMKEVKYVSPGHCVMKGDDFEYDELNRKVIKHVKTPKSSTNNSLEDVIGAYTRVEYNDGRIVDVYLMVSEIKQAKEKTRNKRDDSTWNQWPLEMAKKVTYARAYKELYREPEGLELSFKEDDDENTKDTSYTQVPDDPKQPEPEYTESEVVPQKSEAKAFGD